MRRALWVASWMLTGAVGYAADEIEPLDADFLDYLAIFEADDDNWTLLEESASQPASEESVEEQPSQKPAAPKARKEAAKPAVEER